MTAPEQDVPEQGGEVKLALTADAAAARATQPLTLVLREMEGGAEHEVQFSLVSGGENNGVPQGYQRLLINATGQLWLTVVPAPSPAQAACL